MKNDIASDWDTDRNRRQNKMTETPLRLPTTLPKVLTLGRRKGYPLANWTSVIKGQGNHPPKEILNDGHYIPNTPFPRGDPDAERGSALMAPMNGSQTCPPVLPQQKTRKELVNWTWVDLGNPNAKFDNKTERREFVETEPEEEEDQIQSEERQRKSLDDVE